MQGCRGINQTRKFIVITSWKQAEPQQFTGSTQQTASIQIWNSVQCKNGGSFTHPFLYIPTTSANHDDITHLPGVCSEKEVEHLSLLSLSSFLHTTTFHLFLCVQYHKCLYTRVLWKRVLLLPFSRFNVWRLQRLTQKMQNSWSEINRLVCWSQEEVKITRNNIHDWFVEAKERMLRGKQTPLSMTADFLQHIQVWPFERATYLPLHVVGQHAVLNSIMLFPDLNGICGFF